MKLFPVDIMNAFDAKVYVVPEGETHYDGYGIAYVPLPGFLMLADAEGDLIGYIRHDEFLNGKTRPEIVAEILNRAQRTADPYEE